MDYVYPRPAPPTTCPNCGCTRIGLVGRLKRLCNGCWRVFVVGARAAAKVTS
jgi:hypothetical protein